MQAEAERLRARLADADRRAAEKEAERAQLAGGMLVGLRNRGSDWPRRCITECVYSALRWQQHNGIVGIVYMTGTGTL